MLISSVLDGKDYDVLICYDDKDSDFVLGVLVPTLETRYDYRCFTHHLGSVGGNFGTTCKLTLIVIANKRKNKFIQNKAVHGEYIFVI